MAKRPEAEQASVFSSLRSSVHTGMGSGRGPDSQVRKVTHRRLRYIIVIVIVTALLLASRLFYVQIVQGSTLADTAREFRSRSYSLEAKRGDVIDANGAILATSVERYNVRVDQQEISQYREVDDDGNLVGTGAAAAAKALAPLLDMDRAQLGGLLLGGEEKSRWRLVKSDISPDEWREINALGIRGIYPERYMQREYPNGTVAGNILGYTGETAEDPQPQGRAGIEQTFNELLAGETGTLTVEVGPAGTIFPQGTRHEEPAVDGGTVQLSIDRDLQDATQKAVDDIVKSSGAEWGTAIVIEIGTGRVLALGDSGSPDPSNLASADPEDWNSRAVQGIVEPGSTGKIITMSGALDAGVVTPLDVYPTPPLITMPNGQTIRDNNHHAAENMTAAGILAKSYNTGLVQIGDEMSDEQRFQYMVDFGLGQPTGIELPGEQSGILHPWESWGDRTRYTTMFGQAWSATTLQLGQMIAIVGNDGVKIPLHIVDGTYDRAGNFTPTAIEESEQVISKEAAQTMNQMMQGVTTDGSTGWRARVEGYNVSGKTGTAQVPDEQGRLTKRVGTFTGLLPAEDPQIAVAVVVYNASGAGYGGDTAAVAFADIGSFAMRQMGIPPSTQELFLYPWFERELDDSAD